MGEGRKSIWQTLHQGSSLPNFYSHQFWGLWGVFQDLGVHMLHWRITVKITFSSFLQVYVNGLKHCTFKHRIPLENVSALGIRGDVSQLICGFISVTINLFGYNFAIMLFCSIEKGLAFFFLLEMEQFLLLYGTKESHTHRKHNLECHHSTDFTANQQPCK